MFAAFLLYGLILGTTFPLLHAPLKTSLKNP
jgi:hypothetical protein